MNTCILLVNNQKKNYWTKYFPINKANNTVQRKSGKLRAFYAILFCIHPRGHDSRGGNTPTIDPFTSYLCHSLPAYPHLALLKCGCYPHQSLLTLGSWKPFLDTFVPALKRYTEVPNWKGCLLLNDSLYFLDILQSYVAMKYNK